MAIRSHPQHIKERDRDALFDRGVLPDYERISADAIRQGERMAQYVGSYCPVCGEQYTTRGSLVSEKNPARPVIGRVLSGAVHRNCYPYFRWLEAKLLAKSKPRVIEPVLVLIDPVVALLPAPIPEREPDAFDPAATIDEIATYVDLLSSGYEIIYPEYLEIVAYLEHDNEAVRSAAQDALEQLPEPLAPLEFTPPKFDTKTLKAISPLIGPLNKPKNWHDLEPIWEKIKVTEVTDKDGNKRIARRRTDKQPIDIVYMPGDGRNYSAPPPPRLLGDVYGTRIRTRPADPLPKTDNSATVQHMRKLA